MSPALVMRATPSVCMSSAPRMLCRKPSRRRCSCPKPCWSISAYRGIADQPDRVAALDTELADLGDRYLAGTSTMQWEYLLVTARKR